MSTKYNEAIQPHIVAVLLVTSLYTVGKWFISAIISTIPLDLDYVYSVCADLPLILKAGHVDNALGSQGMLIYIKD